MPRTLPAGVLAGALVLSAALPAGALAQSGGASPGAAPAPPAPAPAPAEPQAPAAAQDGSSSTQGTQRATTPGLGSWRIRGTGYTGSRMTATADLAPEMRGRTVELQRRSGSRWIRAARGTVAASGTARLRWRTSAARRHELRLVRAGSSSRTASSRSSATPSVSVTVYDRITATWYGPGFYGKRTACGQTMSRELVGVAHRTLPCGTQVEVTKGGRSVTVPVVDRGPFANGATVDLTAAAADLIDGRSKFRGGFAVRRDLPRAQR